MFFFLPFFFIAERPLFLRVDRELTFYSIGLSRTLYVYTAMGVMRRKSWPEARLSENFRNLYKTASIQYCIMYHREKGMLDILKFISH